MAETNKLLQSIGAGVNLNMTDVVEKQVRGILTRFKNEIQKAAAQATQFGTQAAKGLAMRVRRFRRCLIPRRS